MDKGRSAGPLRLVTERRDDGTDVLECGHLVLRPNRLEITRRRRCGECGECGENPGLAEGAGLVTTVDFDVRAPAEVLSAPTVARLRHCFLEALALTRARDVVGDDVWFGTLDRAVLLVLEDLEGIADGSVVLTTPDRRNERWITRRAIRAGYWLARHALDTVGQELRWSGTDPEGAAGRLHDAMWQMDVAALFFVPGALLERWVTETGSPGDGELLTMATMAFDHAVALAALEHDEVMARRRR